MDFPLNSSLILAITVGLWLLWVAPYVFRRSDVPVMSAAAVQTVMPAPSSTAIRSSISADGLSQQGNTMYNHSAHQPGNSRNENAAFRGTGSAGRPAAAPVRQPAFRIRYGRTALALAGALALTAAVVGLPLAAFGAASWWLPVGALAAAGAATASLRSLAVRDRRRRVDAAFRAAMSGARQSAPAPVSAPVSRPAPEQQPTSAEPMRQRETALFDRESTPGTKTAPAVVAGTATAPGAPNRRPTAAELRSAALNLAAASEAKAPSGPPKTSTTPWEPVEVPKPTYVDAAVAQRPVPEPLVPPQTPKPAARTSIRAGAVAAAAEAESAGSDAAPGTGKINLDDVLQRRRA
ncbi:hypothetical protein ABIB35_000054 [Arthrobacter sp. UYP6]|uniref:hypothetical protein n=1 Tax=Arthrobacter sp. UYP6 TaxID=1756378 RepID=UPI00339A6B8D